MRSIDPQPFRGFVGDIGSDDLGVRPVMAWLGISCLRIDPAYQREVLNNGARNIGKIAREFDWSKFGVVIVARLDIGVYAIVDGQHRTIAAALRGILEVPCLIIAADPGQQAAAFAAINGAVTKISPLQIFHAELAAGKTSATELRDVCAAAGVVVCRYPIPSSKMKIGETLAIGTLRQCFRNYGAEVLALSLRCVTKSHVRNVGMVNEPIIKAVCNVLDAEASWRSSEAALMAAMREFDFPKELPDAEVVAKQKRIQVSAALSMRLFDFLDEQIGA